MVSQGICVATKERKSGTGATKEQDDETISILIDSLELVSFMEEVSFSLSKSELCTILTRSSEPKIVRS